MSAFPVPSASIVVLVGTLLALGACASAPPASGTPGDEPVRADAEAGLASVGFTLDHLDALGEDVVVEGDTLRFVHIYAEPGPDGAWVFVGDDDEVHAFGGEVLAQPAAERGGAGRRRQGQQHAERAHLGTGRGDREGRRDGGSVIVHRSCGGRGAGSS